LTFRQASKFKNICTPGSRSSPVESLAFGYYFEQTEYPAPNVLVSDDAKEYIIVIISNALLDTLCPLL